MIGETLKSVRQRLDMSQSDVSEKCGVPPSTISAIESGSRKGNFETVSLICKGMGLPMWVVCFLWETGGKNFFAADGSGIADGQVAGIIEVKYLKGAGK